MTKRSDKPADALDVIETQIAFLVRTLEGLGRQTDLYTRLDRAGYLLLRTLLELQSTGVTASITNLAAELGLDVSTVTRQATVLSDQGLIQRRILPADRRSIILSPSPDGLALMEQVRKNRRKWLKFLTDEWAPEEKSELGRTLVKLNDSIRQKTQEMKARGMKLR